jgi:hypothetical protein
MSEGGWGGRIQAMRLMQGPGKSSTPVKGPSGPTSNGLLVCRGRGNLPAVTGEGEKIERLVIGVTFPADKQHRALAAGTRRRLSEFPLLLLLRLPRHPAD